MSCKNHRKESGIFQSLGNICPFFSKSQRGGGQHDTIPPPLTTPLLASN